MTDLKNYFGEIRETPEGWRANCPKCGDTKGIFHWNEEKQVGCCFHSGCDWYYNHGGVTLRRALAHFTISGLPIYSAPIVIKEAEDADLELPESFKQIRQLPRPLRTTLYSYLTSRGISRRVTRAACIGYCQKGPQWGYMIFPVMNEESEVVYWQGRRFKEREPKFWNPKSSKKTELVYNISPTIRPRQIILVESIINALTLETLEKTDTLTMATLGKTISDEQIEYVLQFEKRLKRIYVAMDGDARREGVQIAEKLAKRTPVKIYIVPIPDGEDINSLGRKQTWRRLRKSERFDPRHRSTLITSKVA
jgi:Toprim domain-containing protein